MAYIEFDRVVGEYPSGTTIRALDERDFAADRGELTVILGQSGAGKTGAEHPGGMDTATSGRVVVGARHHRTAQTRPHSLPADGHQFVFSSTISCRIDRIGERRTRVANLP